jgi:hypothetical protein
VRISAVKVLDCAYGADINPYAVDLPALLPARWEARRAAAGAT